MQIRDTDGNDAFYGLSLDDEEFNDNTVKSDTHFLSYINKKYNADFRRITDSKMKKVIRKYVDDIYEYASKIIGDVVTIGLDILVTGAELHIQHADNKSDTDEVTDYLFNRLLDMMDDEFDAIDHTEAYMPIVVGKLKLGFGYNGEIHFMTENIIAYKDFKMFAISGDYNLKEIQVID